MEQSHHCEKFDPPEYDGKPFILFFVHMKRQYLIAIKFYDNERQVQYN